MTTELQKKKERGYVEQFRKDHPDWSKIVEGEKPDFRIRRTSGGDIGLEVVEYHADSQDVPGQKRVAIEARWWKELWPLLDQKRQTLDDLRGVGVHLRFNDAPILNKRDHQALVCELIQVIQLAAARSVPGQSAEVIFGPQATVEAAGRLMQEYYFLPGEKWPLASKNLSHLSVSRWPFDVWMEWHCSNAMAAWVGPDTDEFA